MKTLYFDCFAGAAGDMILGALLDAGLPFDELKGALGSLAVEGWDVSVDRVLKAGISATKFRVHQHSDVASGAGDVASGFSRTSRAGDVASGFLTAEASAEAVSRTSHGHNHHDHGRHHHDHAPHHSLKEIEAAIARSALSEAGRNRAIAMFRRLAEAEAAIHGMAIDAVHLHEVGAIDSIIDIVGAVFALEWFAADRIVVSPLNVGGGMVRSAHGVFPVPAPATVSLLGRAPVYSTGIQAELLTPTGALILTEYATSFGPVPAMQVDRVGYGAGDRDLPETPNVVRVLVGESMEAGDAPSGAGGDTPSGAGGDKPSGAGGDKPLGLSMKVVTLECEIDDMNPQIFGVLMDRLYAAGALEVFYSPVQMKKNRPGTLMTIVARPDDRQKLTDLVFRESTTIGIRYQEVARECLDRNMVTVSTPLGPVRFKVAHRGGQVLNAQPEFDDLVALSGERGIAIKDVQALAHKAWLER